VIAAALTVLAAAAVVAWLSVGVLVATEMPGQIRRRADFHAATRRHPVQAVAWIAVVSLTWPAWAIYARAIERRTR
jgi:hypothetical protein